MLTIRLQRVGKKKFPTYRIIVSEKTRDPQARHVEILGSYNPHDKEKGLVLKEDRIKYWIEKGAQTSNTVFNILLKAGLVTGEKKKSVTITNKRTDKLAKAKTEKEEAKKKADDDKKATEEAKVAEEVVVPELKAEEVAEEKKEEPKKEETPAEEPKVEEPKEEEKKKEEK